MSERSKRSISTTILVLLPEKRGNLLKFRIIIIKFRIIIIIINESVSKVGGGGGGNTLYVFVCWCATGTLNPLPSFFT